MRTQYITDPTVLAQLNSSSPQPRASSSGAYITDPAVLSQLNSAAQNVTPSNYLQNAANFANKFASYSELPLVAAAKAGQAITNIPHNVASIFSPTAASHIPYSTSNMGQVVGNITGVPVPNTSTFNTEANIGSALIPAVGESDILGNALKFGPGMLGDVTRYLGARVIPNAAIGAGFNSQNPALGAIIGGAGATLGAIPDVTQNIINKLGNNAGLTNMTAEGVNKLTQQANDLVNQYQKGYGGLNSVADQPAVAISASTPWDQMTQKMLNENPDLAARLRGDQTLGISRVGSHPEAVRSIFPQDWLEDFENAEGGIGFPKSSGVRKAFDNFTSNPTLGNADFLKQSFNDVSNPNSSQIGLLSQGKNFLKNNIIQPALTKIDPNLAQGYMNADNAFATNSRIYQSSNALNNLIRGTTLDQTPQAIQSILKPVIEDASLPSELGNTPFSKLYNSHMNNIRNLYDSVSTGVNNANKFNASYLGKATRFLQRHPLLNVGAPLIRTAFQTKNALNNPG